MGQNPQRSVLRKCCHPPSLHLASEPLVGRTLLCSCFVAGVHVYRHDHRINVVGRPAESNPASLRKKMGWLDFAIVVDINPVIQLFKEIRKTSHSI